VRNIRLLQLLCLSYLIVSSLRCISISTCVRCRYINILRNADLRIQPSLKSTDLLRTIITIITVILSWRQSESLSIEKPQYFAENASENFKTQEIPKL